MCILVIGRLWAVYIWVWTLVLDYTEEVNVRYLIGFHKYCKTQNMTTSSIAIVPNFNLAFGTGSERIPTDNYYSSTHPISYHCLLLGQCEHVSFFNHFLHCFRNSCKCPSNNGNLVVFYSTYWVGINHQAPSNIIEQWSIDTSIWKWRNVIWTSILLFSNCLKIIIVWQYFLASFQYF